MERVISRSTVPAKVPSLSRSVSLSFNWNVFRLGRSVKGERFGVHSRVRHEGRSGLGEDGEE